MFLDLKECSRAEGATECSDESDTTSATDSEYDEEGNSNESLNAPPVETTYVENERDLVSKGGAGDLSEEFADENKNIIWCLMKQVSETAACVRKVGKLLDHCFYIHFCCKPGHKSHKYVCATILL